MYAYSKKTLSAVIECFGSIVNIRSFSVVCLPMRVYVLCMRAGVSARARVCLCE